MISRSREPLENQGISYPKNVKKGVRRNLYVERIFAKAEGSTEQRLHSVRIKKWLLR